MVFHPILAVQIAYEMLPDVKRRLVHPLCSSFSGRLTPYQLQMESKNNKVIFILGATGSGKSKLSLALAKRFNGEIINSDKMQVHDGLSIITNKVTDEERAQVPHHLLGGLHPDADFSSDDFCREATKAIESILGRGKLPIIAGGSNSYIKDLVEGNGGTFLSRYECCFIWVDVAGETLYRFVSARVDKMVEEGLVEEARGMYRPDGDYNTGVRQSIGVREMHTYFQLERSVDEATKAKLLEAALTEIKENTHQLINKQLYKIKNFRQNGWKLHRIDSTEFFLNLGKPDQDRVWEDVVGRPGEEIVRSVLSLKKA